jgi:hypothetical protein
MFDPCWDNPIRKGAWAGILAELDRQTITDPPLREFLDEFVTWIKAWLKIADAIEITGNL